MAKARLYSLQGPMDFINGIKRRQGAAEPPEEPASARTPQYPNHTSSSLASTRSPTAANAAYSTRNSRVTEWRSAMAWAKVKEIVPLASA